MRPLRIFAIIRHFYFNYNDLDPDPDLPYVHSLFSRRAKFAFQMLVAFVFGGFLVYGTPLKSQGPQAFLVPIISVLSIQDTVGLTIAASFQMLLAIVPTFIFIFILQKIGLGYHSYVAAEFVLLITAFFIGFVVSQVHTSFILRMNRNETQKNMFVESSLFCLDTFIIIDLNLGSKSKTAISSISDNFFNDC
jgi:hypothetical protein